MKLSGALSTLLLLLTEAVNAAHAGKIDASRTITDNTLKQTGVRMLKKEKKKSKAPKNVKAPVPTPTSCSPCYKAADSAAFVTELTTVGEYNVNMPLVLNICAGETIDIPTGGAGNYQIVLKNTAGPGGCTSYGLTINCCGGNCGINYAGDTLTLGYGPLDYHNSDPGVYMQLLLNGITLSSTNSIAPAGFFYGFFELPSAIKTCPNNSLGGFVQSVAPNVPVPVFFN